MDIYKKKYKRALEIMREWVAPCHTKEQLDVLKKTVFSELAETEDERIRKFLVELVSNDKLNGYTGFYKDRNVLFDDVLAYLEKQKEEEGYEAIPVESTLEYKLGFKAGRDSEKQKEQKPFNVCEQCPYYKDCPDYNEKKQEWSAEDKTTIKEICDFLYETSIGIYRSIEQDTFKRWIDWLKSFRPQYYGDVTMTEAYKMGLEAGKALSWKPSEEQKPVVIQVENPNIQKLDPNVIIETRTNGTGEPYREPIPGVKKVF